MRRDRQAADDLAQQMGAIEIDRVCRELLHAVWYGYAVAEAIWEIDGPRVRLADLRVRDPARFRWSADGTPLLVTREQPRGAPLPPAKFVRLTQPRQHGGQPHGPGAAQWCLWPTWLKRQAMRMWAIALEKFGAPTAVGRVSRTAAAGEIDEMLGAMQAMAAGTGVVIPDGQSLELLDSARRAGGDFAAFVGAMDSMIADAVLGQRATSEIGPWRGTADVQATVLERLVAADARRLSAALRQSVATWLTGWNHPGAAVPAPARNTAPPEDLEARARRDEIVARTAGLRPSLAYVEQTYGGGWEPAAEPAPAPAPGDDRRLASPTDPPRPDPPPPPATARNAGGNDPRALAAADPDDPVAKLVARTRETLGPLIDAWADRIRDGIGDADTLAQARERLDNLLAWTADPRAPTPDVAAAAALAPALAAAQLAGRYDVEGDRTGPALAAPTETAFASAAAKHTQLPFDEQVEFFRSKLDLTTQAWTDIWQEQHDRAFVVAGAAHANIVQDLRKAVDKAIADGATIDTFRKDFDAIVARRGWSYNGGRDWRTRVIYSTNLRTSYAAGRYRQMKDIAGRRPYWRYRHSDASEDPRYEHLAWDGIVLRHDDPWWRNYYPPNGWGCKCFVETLDEAALERLGKTGPDRAPEIRNRTVTVGVNGPSPRTVAVPEGIDPGWAYAPGRSLQPPPAPPDPFAIPEISRADATARQIGPQAGSNPGGLFESTDGRARYVKFYDDPAQAYGEAVANRVYRELGIDAPASALVRHNGAVVGIANEIVDHAGTLGGRRSRPTKARAQKVLQGYAADVWLANWDAVGQNLDNIVLPRGRPRNAVARIDQGGALLFRARHGRKPPTALNDIAEWDGFANRAINPAYAKVLQAAGHSSPDDLGRQAIRQIDAIERLGRRTDDFRDLAPTVRGIADADRDAIRHALANRARLLRSQIAPRLRAAIDAAESPPAHQRRTQTALGAAFRTHRDAGRSKTTAHGQDYGMTDPELASGYGYTLESRAWWSYRALNKALREQGAPGQPKLSAKHNDLRRTLNDALDKLPDYPAKGLRRGVNLKPDDIARYVPGQIVTEDAFTSVSTGAGFLGNARFIIDSLHGKHLKWLSANPSEGEVLFKSGTRFRVVSNEPHGGITKIELEEVD